MRWLWVRPGGVERNRFVGTGPAARIADVLGACRACNLERPSLSLEAEIRAAEALKGVNSERDRAWALALLPF